jgi:hypothetical protein
MSEEGTGLSAVSENSYPSAERIKKETSPDPTSLLVTTVKCQQEVLVGNE